MLTKNLFFKLFKKKTSKFKLSFSYLDSACIQMSTNETGSTDFEKEMLTSNFLYATQGRKLLKEDHTPSALMRSYHVSLY